MRTFKNKISNRSNSLWETNDEKFFWRNQRRKSWNNRTNFHANDEIFDDRKRRNDYDFLSLFSSFSFSSRWFEVIMKQLHSILSSKERISTKCNKTSNKCWLKSTTLKKCSRFVTSFVNSSLRQTLCQMKITMLHILWTSKSFVNCNDESNIISMTFCTNSTIYVSIETNICLL